MITDWPITPPFASSAVNHWDSAGDSQPATGDRSPRISDREETCM
ncbi:unnamed protein product [Staurois parvus]|uniref:Uncharacterized protein n=1 Tax=Staurois parvus TaxID=386267 RepID=A0ABN9ADM7_9NEOB|nr:unnamed protein product [Staurois parvus]